MHHLKIIILCLFCTQPVLSQIVSGTDTLYGNEWFKENQAYTAAFVGADGVYRIPVSTLKNANIPVATVKGSQFRMYRMGQEVPIYTSTNALFSDNDYIEFYATKHRAELDVAVYRTGSYTLLNPDFSLFNDTIPYYLTWETETTNTKRLVDAPNNLTNAPAKDNWFWYDDRQTFNQQDIQFKYGDVFVPDFSKGEGYGSAWAKDFKLTMTPQNRVNTEGGKLTIRWTNQQYSISVLKLNNEQLDKSTIPEFIATEKNFNLTAAQMQPTMEVALSGTYSDIDRVSVGVAQLTYARQFNFNNAAYFEFFIEASDVSKYLEIDAFNTTTSAPILYDVTNNLRIVTTVESGKVKVVIPPSVLRRKMVLFNPNTAVKTITALNTTTFKNYKNETADYLIVTADRFIATGITAEYAQYRQSAAGGSFKTSVIDIKDIYNHFGYGIQRHPMALRNFTHFIKKYGQNPKYILLIGKAREFNAVRTDAQLKAASNQTFDIPTWGFPGSDVLLAASHTSDAPLIPIGRIPATVPSEVKIYLEKVKALEYVQKNATQTVQERDWFKNMLHLSGGGTVGEAIKTQMTGFAQILERGKTGAAISTFYKNTTDPVQIAQNDKIFERINQGVSLITFFGHSATSVLDFDVNNPNLLNNKDKYPAFVALGCSAGNVHQASIGVSENLVFYPNKGTVLFAGTSGTSYLNSLSNFGNTFYSLIADSSSQLGFGQIVQTAISKMGTNINLDVKSILQAFTINGDPALKINAAAAADYVIDPASVRTDPTLVTAQTDSVKVLFDLVNLGMAVKDTIMLAFKQQMPDGTVSDLKTIAVPTPQYKTPLTVTIPLKKQVGINRLLITVDASNRVEERPAPVAETNNDLTDPTGKKGYEFLIMDNNLRPAYPPDFGIVGTQPIILKASTSNPLAASQTYLFELDTTRLFNSPIKQQQRITQLGGVVKWQPAMLWKDSTVYYWRTAIDNPTLLNWQNSSFTYIKDKYGWAQGHYFQFLENKMTTMGLNEQTRAFEYVDDDFVFGLKGGIENPVRYPLILFNYQAVTTNTANFSGMPESCFMITVIDFDKTRGNGTAWRPYVDYNYGINSPITRNNNVGFTFDTNSSDIVTGRQGAIKFIEDIIPDNTYVLLYVTTKDGNIRHKANTWEKDSTDFGKNIFQVLEKQGAKFFRNLITRDSVHYFIIFKKNGNKILKEKIQSSYSEGVDETIFIPRKWDKGTIETDYIGPVRQWESLQLDLKKLIGDTATFDIIGKTNTNIDTVILQNLNQPINSLSSISAAKFPVLKIRFNSRDIIQRSSPQLNSWRIYYTGLPDLAVNPNISYKKYKDTLQQGDNFNLDIGFENIGVYKSDSVTIGLTLKNDSNREQYLQQKIKPLAANDTASARFAYNTKLLEGKQQVLFEINPKQAQPETHFFNNYLQTDVSVERDKANPLLNVVFDGVRIMNNDIVSSRPTIGIELKDDNGFLALKDTALFKIAIEPLEGSGKRREVNFNDPSVKFTPANLNGNSDNKATIEFRPDFLTDGKYRLIVNARDVAGNKAGASDYSVVFQIITKQAISNLLPYPNPFSTSTRFAYTLTGDSPPQYFKIQIMTLSGQIVREITQNEMGALRIGTHLTDYAWDGKDEYGGRLANGVYLYRVIAKNKNGQKMEGVESVNAVTNAYFKNDYGKIVIIR